MKSFILTVISSYDSYIEHDYQNDQRPNEEIAKEIFKNRRGSLAIVLHNSRKQILITKQDLKKGIKKPF